MRFGLVDVRKTRIAERCGYKEGSVCNDSLDSQIALIVNGDRAKWMKGSTRRVIEHARVKGRLKRGPNRLRRRLVSNLRGASKGAINEIDGIYGCGIRSTRGMPGDVTSECLQG